MQSGLMKLSKKIIEMKNISACFFSLSYAETYLSTKTEQDNSGRQFDL